MTFSKTSLNGVFALLITVCVALLASGSPLIGATATLWIMLSLAVMRSIVGFLQADAPTVGDVKAMWSKGAALLLVAALSVGVVGCVDWERSTFQSLAASKATIDTAAADYRAGVIPQSGASYALITQAQKAQTAAVESFLTWESIKGVAGDAGAVAATNQQTAVVTALLEVPPLVLKIKALYSK